MKKYNKKKAILDIVLGDIGEKESKKPIEKHLNTELTKTTKHHNFDLKNEEKKIYVEIKTRRCKSTRYDTLFISYAKYKFIKKFPEYTYYIVYNLYDGLFIYQFNEDDIHFTQGGRTDRGYNEVKKVVNIPTKLLKKII
jgi:hypothetical protein